MEHPWKSRAQRLRWGLGVASFTAVAALAVAWIGGATASTTQRAPGGEATGAAPVDVEPAQAPDADPTTGPAPAAGTGRDPLTPSELERARAAALDASLRAGTTDVTGAAGPEYLSFELVDAKSAAADAPRRAAVYFYDYTANKLVKRVVNLRTGAVEGTFSAAGRQPPPSDREVAKALELFLADGLSADFKARYQKATGKAFAPGQVEVTGTTYVARPADTGADQCGAHRCVQFITQVPNGPFIDITDIVVDLSGRTVARLR
ncbi:hypothetical protein [Phytohabitans kaempferiae]|uniref:Tat pathway signal sequence domain protein n=1 Tax=Phytohabitans kaempferiae TaxID=1620943 RepID=A0ABV6LUI4_9ACTN